MKISVIPQLRLWALCMLLAAAGSCSEKKQDNVEPEIESAPTGDILVEPYCDESFTNLGTFTSQSTSFGYYFHINFKYEYKRYPYSYIYLILPDGQSFLPLPVNDFGKKRAAMGFSRLWYSCCAASPPQEFEPIYDIRDMGRFDSEPRRTGYHYPKSGNYKLVIIFKETEGFEKGAFLSTKIIDLPNSLRDFPCKSENSEYKPIVESFTVDF